MPWRTVGECVVRPACTDMNRGWHFKSTKVLGMVESGSKRFRFYQIKIWEYSMLFTKKSKKQNKTKNPKQIILTSDTLPDLLTQKQRMEMADIYCRYMPLSPIERRLVWGLQGPSCKIFMAAVQTLLFSLAFNPSLDGDLWHPSTEHGEYYMSVSGITHSFLQQSPRRRTAKSAEQPGMRCAGRI